MFLGNHCGNDKVVSVSLNERLSARVEMPEDRLLEECVLEFFEGTLALVGPFPGRAARGNGSFIQSSRQIRQRTGNLRIFVDEL